MTGLYPAKHGVRLHSGTKLRSWIYTLPQFLQKHGYYTRAEVTGPLLPIIGLNKGFNNYNYRDRRVTVYTDWWKNFLRSLDNINDPWFILLHLWELHSPRYLPKSIDPNKIPGRNKYEKALVCLDEKIGELLDKIELQNTTIALLGDHGEYIPSSLFKKLEVKIKK